MQKIKMSRGTLLTFKEGCNKYLENCQQRDFHSAHSSALQNHNQTLFFQIVLQCYTFLAIHKNNSPRHR